MTPTRRETALSPAAAFAAAALALAAATAASGRPLLRAPFLWDDYALVVGNDGVAGFDPARLRWMFTTLYQTTYQPFGWLAIAAARGAVGLSAAGHHLVNLAAHWAAGLALFAFARRLLRAHGERRADYAAFAAAVLFVVHPAQTFSAGWVTELPDILATVFFLAALTVYLGPVRRGRLPACWLLFLISLLFRWKGIFLPLALSVLDWRPLKRDWKALLKEKLPFWSLALAALGVNAAAKLGNDIGLAFSPAAFARGLALFSWLLVWPHDILPLYSLKDPETIVLPAALAVGLALAVAAWLWLGRRKRPAALAAGLFFVAALGPPLLSGRGGALVVYPHYAYLAGLPLFLLLGAGLARLGEKRGVAASVLPLVLLAGAWTRESVRHNEYRRDETVFWTRALALDRGSLMSYTNLSDALSRAGRFNDSYYYLEAQRAFNPADQAAAKSARDHIEALRRAAPGLKPDLIGFWSAAAGDLVAADRPEDALILCGKALRRAPRDPRAHAAAAKVFEALGDAARAADHRRRA